MQNHERLRDAMHSFALKVGKLFDGMTMMGQSTIYVDGDRITAVDRSGAVPSDRILVDLGSDSCLMPGLIDTHLHLALNASTDVVGAVTKAADDELLDSMRSAARTALAAGITTVRDLGDRGFLSLILASENIRFPELGPEIIAAGPPLTTPGGHCHFLGGETYGRQALVTAVRDRYERGCSVVKIMASGGNITPGSAPYEAQYSLDDIRVVVTEAHRLGMSVAAHAHAGSAIRDALAAGVDTIEHVSFASEDQGFKVDPVVVRKLAESRAFANITMVGWSDPSQMSDTFRSSFESFKSNARAMYAQGLQFTVGSDSGTGPLKPHDILPSAAPDLAEIGIQPLDVMRTLTSRAALACGIEGRKGRIRVGADADFLAVIGDPLADLRNLRKVKAVYRAGRRVH